MPLDIGSGLLILLALNKLGIAPLDGFSVLAAVMFSLLPDLDFVVGIRKFGYGKFSHRHRDLLHSPIGYLLFGGILASLLGTWTAALFIFCGIAHFAHDSVGMGWGVRWLYPFSKKYFKFFASRDGITPKKLVVAWTPEEQDQMAEKFGDSNWIKNYLKFSKEFIFELAVLLISVLLIIFYFS